MTNKEQSIDQSSSDNKGRGRSMAGFPYVDLDLGVETAKYVFEMDGSCTFEQLSEKSGQAIDSNALRIRINTTWRQYGLIVVNGDRISLSDLGKAVLQPATERQARVEAFLRVPIYKDIFNKFRGETLPASKVLEQVMEDMGVAPKQSARARQILMRSAKQAGLFEDSDFSLAIPRGVEIVEDRVSEPQSGSTNSPAEVTTTHSKREPIFEALWGMVPPSGAEWSIEARAKWLNMLSNALDMSLTAPDNTIEVCVSVVKKVR
jgi:hypothetical protein